MVENASIKKRVFLDRYQEKVKVLFCILVMTILGSASFPLPFSPVPLSLGPHLAIMMGVVLGPISGAVAIGSYLVEGILGFPVFSLGRSGLAHLLGPTGGYLIGYLAAAFVAGIYLFQKTKTLSSGALFLRFFLCSCLIYAFGWSHLATFVGIEKAFFLGVLPFLPFDLFKILCCVSFVKKFINE